MANNAIRYKNDVPLYKVSIQATPFSMTWTKEGFGIKRSFGRALASIGVISKTENSEDTAANNIAAMYPESEREQIKGQFKDIVKGKVWASVADKIVFARDKISITLGMISGTKNIHITKAEEDEAFKKRIFDMYKAMDDTPITIQDGLTRQDGQEGLTRQDGQVQFMEGIEDIKDV
jgi:molybdopterin-binding protein